MSHKELIRSFINAINEQDWDRATGFLHPGVVRHRQPPFQGELTGRAEFREFLVREAETFPDAIERIHLLVEEGVYVSALLSFRGTQAGALGPFPRSGKVLEAEYQCLFRIEEGQIAEVWAHWDNLHALIALGHYAGR
jgi:steroid delta-isomerase-like uncharacterized protein